MVSKPKLRMAPPPAVLAEQQAAVESLLKLDEWTQEPVNPPPKKAEPKPAPKAPALPDRPWRGEGVSAAIHSYNIHVPVPLFLMLDFIWKRQGYKSLRHLLLAWLTEKAHQALKEMGEKP